MERFSSIILKLLEKMKQFCARCVYLKWGFKVLFLRGCLMALLGVEMKLCFVDIKMLQMKIGNYF
jgi:hypothetical protein